MANQWRRIAGIIKLMWRMASIGVCVSMACVSCVCIGVSIKRQTCRRHNVVSNVAAMAIPHGARLWLSQWRGGVAAILALVTALLSVSSSSNGIGNKYFARALHALS